MRPRACLALACACACAAPAQGAEFGLESRWISDAAPVFGEYADVDDAGYALVGDVAAAGRWLDDDAGYWRLWGRGLGLDSYGARLEAGRQGGWALSLDLSGSEQVLRIDGSSPYASDGDHLRLPGGWVSGATTSAFTALPAADEGFRQRRERDAVRLAGRWVLDRHWTFRIDGGREQQDGTRALGGVSYVDASRGYGAVLPVPRDAEVTDLRAGLSWNSGRLAADIAVSASRFDNEVEAVTWDLPFTGVLAPAADFGTGVGTLSGAPDHGRVELRGAGSWAPVAGLGLSWDTAWARTVQDDPLLPYTANSSLLVARDVPVGSADAELETTSLHLRGVWRPRTTARHLRRLTLRAGWHLDDRDVDLVRAPFDYVRGDGIDQGSPTLAILNTGHDRRRETFELSGDYRASLWRSRLTLAYEYEEIERQNVAVEQTETDRWAFTWRARPHARVTGRLEASFADRAASTYDFRASFLARRTTAFVNATPDDQRFDNHPLLRQFHLANVETTGLDAELGWLVSDTLQLALDVEVQDLDYDESELGLLDTRSLRYGLDAQYTSGDALTAFLWADRTRYEADAAGRSFAGGAEKPANRIAAPLPQGSDPARTWFHGTRDDVASLGAGFAWTLSERVDLEGSYTFVRTESENAFATGGAADLDPGALPDLETTLHTLRLRSTFHWREGTDLALHYERFRFEADDWARDGVGPQTLPTVLALGEDAYDDDVHFIGATVRYRIR